MATYTLPAGFDHAASEALRLPGSLDHVARDATSYTYTWDDYSLYFDFALLEVTFDDAAPANYHSILQAEIAKFDTDTSWQSLSDELKANVAGTIGVHYGSFSQADQLNLLAVLLFERKGLNDDGTLRDPALWMRRQPRPNQAPIAIAGRDQSVETGTQVTLDGSHSYDPDGDTITFSWFQQRGPSVRLSDDFAEQPTFTARDEGTYAFELTVSDGTLSHGDIVKVIASATPPPRNRPQSLSPAAINLYRLGSWSIWMVPGLMTLMATPSPIRGYNSAGQQ